MAEGTTPEERTEEATPKRRKEFRDRGEVAKSQEMSSVVGLVTAMACIYTLGPGMSRRILAGTSFAFSNLHLPDLTFAAVEAWSWTFAFEFARIAGPMFGILAVAGVAGCVAQTGWMMSPEAIEPKLERLNPLSKAQQIFFSSRTAFEALKVLMKLTFIGVPLSFTIYNELARLPAIVGINAAALGGQAGMVAVRVSLTVCVLLLILAISDFAFQKWSLERRMKMTMQEAKQEAKDTEGDPHIKGRRRAIQREMSMNRMMANVPKADVVINNPTHFSVALKYDAQGHGAPVVLAKGQDHVAMRIREIARDSEVPMVSNPPLCRTIFKTVKIGGEIPPNLYRAVAEVLAYVYRKRSGRSRRN